MSEAKTRLRLLVFRMLDENGHEVDALLVRVEHYLVLVADAGNGPHRLLKHRWIELDCAQID